MEQNLYKMIKSIKNIKNSHYDNVLNINSERMYRQAEDDFFYFFQTKKAEKKLKAVLKFDPCHIKSMKLLGDVYFTDGKTDKAFEYYSRAAALKPEDAKILANLASVNEISGRYEIALQFTETAFKNLKINDTILFSELSALKINLLIKLQKYSDAQKFLENTNRRLSYQDNGKYTSIGYDILKKKIKLKEKIKRLNIQVV